MFPALNLPPANLQLRNYNGKVQVLDMIRKINVDLTPEEWVRQHLLHFLIREKGYPQGLIEVEKSIKLFNTEKRVDILVRTNELKPLLLVECKAPHITLKQAEANQLARYQITLQAPYCMLSNGMQHFSMQFTGKETVFLDQLPDYSQIPAPPFR
ncbi:MAG TPA: type I restriction enzyme HsdR N-terminal domain-containing protein [Bacteroidia bacterium]|jgi:hypothetical protein|nr:type I restriction enzyme HsdR N-terminal domain-containing protein [Bacteroidia bacterium]